MADAPWVKVYTGDFLQGVGAANMTAEEIGVYTVVLFLIAERGGPIEDDRRWIAGRAGVASTRRCGTILDRLTALGKLVVSEGRIGNGRMLAEVAHRAEKSDKARKAANARWGMADEGDEVPVLGNNGNLSPRKNADKTEINHGKNRDKIALISQNRQISAVSDDADGYADAYATGDAPCARDSELRENNTTHPIPEDRLDAGAQSGSGSGRVEPEKPVHNEPDRLSDGDLWDWYQEIARASGHNPSQPGQIDRAMGFVKRWRDDGLDLEKVIVPTIKAVVAETRDPTRTLGRFDARIRHEAARLAATPEGRKYVPPPSPVLAPDGEDPEFRPMREALLAALGHATYSAFCNAVRFEDAGDCGPGRRVVKIIDGNKSRPLMDAERTGIVRQIAKKHGWSDVW